MKIYLSILTIIALIVLPIMGNAAAIKNEDSEVHQVKVRRSGENWVYVEVNPKGAKYFNCRFGCEIAIDKTESAVQLETDADVIIKNGVLVIK